MHSLRYMRFAGIVLILVLAVAFVYYGYSQSYGQQRHVRLNGVFVLVDEARLLDDIENILHDKASPDSNALHRIEKRLGENPFIDSVSVRYTWPNELVVDINEVSPKAAIHGHGFLTGDCNVISDGRVLSIPSIPVIELESIKFDTSSCRRIMQMLRYITYDIDSIVLMSNENLRVIKGDIQYILGSDLASGFEQFALLDKRLREQGQSRLIVDLRYIAGAAVREVVML